MCVRLIMVGWPWIWGEARARMVWRWLFSTYVSFSLSSVSPIYMCNNIIALLNCEYKNISNKTTNHEQVIVLPQTILLPQMTRLIVQGWQLPIVKLQVDLVIYAKLIVQIMVYVTMLVVLVGVLRVFMALIAPNRMYLQQVFKKRRAMAKIRAMFVASLITMWSHQV